MAAVSDIVQLAITLESNTISRASFGIPLIAAYHTHWTDRVRTYSANSVLSDMVDEGFTTNDPTYTRMAAIISQSPKPSTVKIGRLSASWTMVVELIPAVADNTVYSGTVDSQAWTFNSGAGATLSSICTGIASAIDALTGVSASPGGGTEVTITAAAAATTVEFSPATDSAGVYTLEDISSESGITADLVAIRDQDHDWFWLALDQASSAAQLAAAAWAETRKDAFFITTTLDTAVLDNAVTTDVGSAMKALAYKNTVVLWHERPQDGLAEALIGVVAPSDPGTVNFAYRQPSGVAVSDLSGTQQTAAKNKYVSVLTATGGFNIILWGRTPSGQPADLIVLIAWLYAHISEEVFAFLAGSPRVPYTNTSVRAIEAVIEGVLNRGIARGVVASDPAPFAEGPADVRDVSAVDRALRHLPDVYFTAVATGAIETVKISGKVSV